MNYIERAVSEFMSLKNLSIKELSYKLQAKGIDKDLLDNYISCNIDELLEYEKRSAQNIFNKKSSSNDKIEIKQYLLKKGYKGESIKECSDNN